MHCGTFWYRVNSLDLAPHVQGDVGDCWWFLFLPLETATASSRCVHVANSGEHGLIRTVGIHWV